MNTITYTPSPGEEISETARQMQTLAQETNKVVQATFNGITFTACNNSTVKEIVADWAKKRLAAVKKYKASPAGEKAAAVRQLRIKEAQAKIDGFMQQLPYVFSYDDLTLNWLGCLQDPSDLIGIKLDVFTIVNTFKAKGYLPGVNTGSDFDGNDRDNFFRYIVGQALDGLIRVGAIHHIIHKFIADWKQKFINN